MTLKIVNRNLAEVQQSLTAYLPGGELWEAAVVPGTNLNALMAGLSGVLLDVENFYAVYNSEFIPSQPGTAFLEDWERALLIPDDCFPGPDEPDREVRRLHVLAKLASLGVQTAEDFERLALIFGKVVTVSALSEIEFPPYDIPFQPISLNTSRFTIVVTGVDVVSNVPPYDIPLDLTSGETLIECLFNKLKPTNCAVLFKNTA